MHVWRLQAFIIYIAAPLKHTVPLEGWMKNLPPNLEATHIYTARLTESGARSVRIIIPFLETSSSSAQAAASQCRWLCPLNQEARQHRRLHRAIFCTHTHKHTPVGSKFGRIALTLNRFASPSLIARNRLI